MSAGMERLNAGLADLPVKVKDFVAKRSASVAAAQSVVDGDTAKIATGTLNDQVTAALAFRDAKSEVNAAIEAVRAEAEEMVKAAQ